MWAMRYQDGRGPLPPAGIHRNPWTGLPSDLGARRRALAETALYRFFAECGTLLYVGITNDLECRWKVHRSTAPWWHLQDRATVEWFPNRIEAERAERHAIKTERPRWNSQHSPTGAGRDLFKDNVGPRFRPDPVAEPSTLIVDHRAAAARLAELAATVDVRDLPFRKRRKPPRSGTAV